MATKSVSIRMEEEMRQKLTYVAKYKGRSINSHVLMLIRNDIEMFEEKYGSITGGILPEKNIKVPKKKKS